MSTKKSEQSESFIKAARELGTDESEEIFDKVLKKIASAPPPKSVQKRKSVPRKNMRGSTKTSD